MNERNVFVGGRMVTAIPALLAFYQRISSGPTLEALCEVTAIEPDMALIMIPFLEYALQHDSPKKLIATLLRLLKPMEIPSPFLHESIGRIFVWLDRGDRMAAKDHIPDKPEGKVTEITGRASRKVKEEPEGPLDNPKATLHIYEYKRDVGGVLLNTWYWMIQHDKKKHGGYADSREDAATKAYMAFYQHSTLIKFHAALMPRAGMKVVLMGNWITTQEYDDYKRKDMLEVIPDVVSDDREDTRMFVMGYASTRKDKVVVKAENVTKQRRVEQDNVHPQNHILTLESGVKLEGNMDWRVYRPELRVMGEVMCCKCFSTGDSHHMNLVYVHGYGPRCGPCFDYMYEVEGLDTIHVDLPDQG